eukprot:jgi/Mesvir1/27133/Mv20805-RA.1
MSVEFPCTRAGGDAERERLAAHLVTGAHVPGVVFSTRAASTELGVDDGVAAPRLKDLPVFVSSGHCDVRQVMTGAGVAPARLTVCKRAVDTVTNFTTSLGFMRDHGIGHVYVVTSAYHMPRASIIARVIMGWSRISFTTVALPSSDPKPESVWRAVRDTARALLWVLTGIEGSILGYFVHPSRFRDRDK